MFVPYSRGLRRTKKKTVETDDQRRQRAGADDRLRPDRRLRSKQLEQAFSARVAELVRAIRTEDLLEG
jgi:hypothetical protein